MTSRRKNVGLNVAQSSRFKRRKELFATFAWAALAPLLIGCGTGGSTSGPPSIHANAWLSYKVNTLPGPGCGAYANCAGLLDFNDSNGLSEASKYYCSIGIDPTDCANGQTPQYTFRQWKADNGFPATGFPPAHAFYANKGDLQIGRDMNCVKNFQNVACYVTNYGPPPFIKGAQNPAWPDLDNAVDAAINQNSPFATVAMVFNPNRFPNGDQVTFYVFLNNGNPADGTLVNSAALDGEGPKSVPRMCMACHGGTYVPNNASSFPFNSSAPGINFLFFDVFFFHYSPDVTSNSLSNPIVQEGFRQLNHLVKLTHTSPSPGVSDLAILEAINDEYPLGVDNQGSVVPNDPPPPSGWSANPNLYKSLFRPYCRSCHLASDILSFRNYSEFQANAASIQAFVCSVGDMPQAEVPFFLKSGSGSSYGMWSDGQALNDLNVFLNSQLGSGSGCPQQVQ
jgi:hypothetical protein